MALQVSVSDGQPVDQYGATTRPDASLAPDPAESTATPQPDTNSPRPIGGEEREYEDEIETKDEKSQDVAGGDVEKAEQAATLDPHAHAVASEDFSVFTVGQKRAIIVAGSFAAWFSPMTGSIYFPSLNQISSDLHVSSTAVNLTVTTYLIFQGISPMMIAGFSDKAGRRPAYFICFTIYIIANLALALQNNYVALLILRMLQAAGSSGTVSLSNGMVGDCVTSAERGKYVAYASAGTMLGPTLSPILGGLLGEYLGWHWIFWFLLILSCAYFTPLALFLPETGRKLVGDGSIPPPWTSANFSDHWRHQRRAKLGIPVDQAKLAELRKNYRLTVPNPLSTLRVLSDFESSLLLVSVGLGLACFYAVSTGASEAFSTLYGFSDLQVALMFLPVGAGSVISVFTTGKLVDFNYRRHARKLNFPLTRTRQTDLTNFPIEKARLELALPFFLVAAVSVIGYGWTLDHKISLAGPIILLFLFGYTMIASSQCLTILMVDIYPGQPATATAANNVVRCLLGAAASAAIGPMSQAMGKGWAYTLLGLLFGVATLGPMACMRYGVRWRQAKKEKAKRREKAREADAQARQ